MRLPRRRLRPLRKLARPAPAARRETEPLPRVEEVPLSEASTEFNVPSVLLQRPGDPKAAQLRSQESTVEMLSVEAELVTEPPAPGKLEFHCACGAKLIATTATYDKHSRCGSCQTVLLLSLVYDTDQRSYEIVPFRVNPESGP
jgi:hypothetical protein